jgi:spore coat polysaccharide biosynthesis protein SpsF (cytidylyltransferase family)
MIIGIVQARMGSTRLPGKVLAPILGKPMIWRILERVMRARCLDRTVIATTTEPSDDELATFAEENDIGCYRGSVDDIVDRYCGAAQHFKADIIVRIWGDCPFIDPEVIDQAVDRLLANNLDHVNTFMRDERTFPYGMDLEAYRRQTLEAIRNQTEDHFFREFPFEYIMRFPEQFRSDIIRCQENLAHIHLTVDYPQDLELARAIYAALYNAETPFSFREAVKLVTEQPDISKNRANLTRNADYLRKKERR